MKNSPTDNILLNELYDVFDGQHYVRPESETLVMLQNALIKHGYGNMYYVVEKYENQLTSLQSELDAVKRERDEMKKSITTAYNNLKKMTDELRIAIKAIHEDAPNQVAHSEVIADTLGRIKNNIHDVANDLLTTKPT